MPSSNEAHRGSSRGKARTARNACVRWFVRRQGVLTFGAFSLLYTIDSSAHLDLLVPEPRERGSDRRSTDSNLKKGPCGQDRNNGRTRKVSVYRPGETITVTWNEYVNHVSYYRVAFDVDGDDDFPVFGGRYISPEGDDPAALCPVDGRVILAYNFDDRTRGEHSMEIRLPDVECENCTLQVVQFMYGGSRPYYFQCADLALRHGGADAGPPIDGGEETLANEIRYQAAAACWTDLDALELPQGSNEPAADTPIESDTELASGNSGCSLARGLPSSRAPASRALSWLVLLLVGWRRFSREAVRRAPQQTEYDPAELVDGTGLQ